MLRGVIPCSIFVYLLDELDFRLQQLTGFLLISLNYQSDIKKK